jgi:hypothetical protein
MYNIPNTINDLVEMFEYHILCIIFTKNKTNL